MICDVILRKKAGGFIARAKDYPDVIAEENSREKAIDLIRVHLLDYLTKETELIRKTSIYAPCCGTYLSV